MERLVSDLLDVTRIEGGKLPLKIEECRVADLVNLAVEETTPYKGKKTLELRPEIGDGVGSVRCDRNRMIQVFANLVGNARKCTPEAGTITIGVQNFKSEYRFYVRDTGIGIHPKQLPHVFDRFWRSRERERDRKGAGLGLTIAKGVVESHGGRIWIESVIGQGTTVYFTLPAAD